MVAWALSIIFTFLPKANLFSSYAVCCTPIDSYNVFLLTSSSILNGSIFYSLFQLTHISLNAENLDSYMIHVEGGTFEMGSDQLSKEDGPIHTVELGDFYLCQYLVTQSLWESVIGENPSKFPHSSRPVETVNWYDAIMFCNKLSKLRGIDSYYEIDSDRKDPNNTNKEENFRWWVRSQPQSNGFRLPTEAEWEYAAKGGKYARKTELLFSGSNNQKEVAWFEENSMNISQLVGVKGPNVLGLFDMSGNVDEWCQDWYDEYYYMECRERGVVKDPQGSKQGNARVVRGGSWDYDDSLVFRPAGRNYFDADFRYSTFGFRVCQHLR